MSEIVTSKTGNTIPLEGIIAYPYFIADRGNMPFEAGSPLAGSVRTLNRDVSTAREFFRIFRKGDAMPVAVAVYEDSGAEEESVAARALVAVYARVTETLPTHVTHVLVNGYRPPSIATAQRVGKQGLLSRLLHPHVDLLLPDIHETDETRKRIGKVYTLGLWTPLRGRPGTVYVGASEPKKLHAYYEQALATRIFQLPERIVG